MSEPTLCDEIAMRRTRDQLLDFLRNQSGAPDRDHSRSERLLMAWMRTFDVELADAWDKASEDWWYA